MLNLQMYYTLSTIDFIDKPLASLLGLQRDNIVCVKLYVTIEMCSYTEQTQKLGRCGGAVF